MLEEALEVVRAALEGYLAQTGEEHTTPEHLRALQRELLWARDLAIAHLPLTGQAD